jgi:cell division protein ZapA
MSDTIKIKLKIAGRVYPLTISSDQEASLRVSASKIDLMMKQLENNYAVRDKQDVLAMCALQFASQVEQKALDKEYVSEHVEEKLNALNDMLQTHLSL